MDGRSKATLFLIEKLIVIAVFALCASACVSIFADAFLTANSTRDLKHALITAKNGAERLKAHRDLETTAESLGGSISSREGNSAVVYYNDDWRVSGEPDAAYVMSMRRNEGDAPLIICELSVSKVGGEELVSFSVAYSDT